MNDGARSEPEVAPYGINAYHIRYICPMAAGLKIFDVRKTTLEEG